MNEFDALLESFSKLKKRTLSVKLRSIRENFDEAPEEEPQDPMMDMGMGMEIGPLESSPYSHESHLDSIERIQVNAKIAFDSLTRDERKQGDFGKDSIRFEEFLLGSAPHSLESQMAQANGSDGLLDKTLVAGVFENLSYFIEMLAKNKLPDDRKKRMGTILSIGKQGSVVIHNKGTDGEGLVFKDNLNFLKTLAFVCKRKFAVTFNTYDEEDLSRSGTNDSIDRLGIKNVSPVINTMSKMDGSEEDKFRDDAAEGLGGFKDDFSNNLSMERDFSSAYQSGQAAISLDDQERVESSSNIAGDMMSNIMSNFQGLSREINIQRDPDFIIPTRRGFVEGWVTEEGARMALASLGFTPEDVRVESLIQKQAAKHAFRDDPDRLPRLKKLGIIQSVNQEIFTIDIKSNYQLEIGDYKAGEVILSELQSGDLHTKCMAIEQKIRDLAIKALVKNEDGENIEVHPLKDAAHIISEKLKRSNSYDDVIGNSPVGQVIRTIEENDLTTKDGAERAREIISRYSIFTYLEKCALGKQSEFVQYVKDICNSCCQSESITSVNSLTSPVTNNFHESSTIDQVINGWMSNQYNFSTDKYQFRFTDIRDPSKVLTLKLAPCNVRAEFFEKRLKFEVHFSEGLQTLTNEPLEARKEVIESVMKQLSNLLLNQKS